MTYLPFNSEYNLSSLTGYIAHPGSYALLEVGGRDASIFLQSQLTQDFQSLPDDQARLAGLCSIKGRLMADFLGWHGPSLNEEEHRSILLLLSADLISEVTQTLSKFILRRKVTLNDASSKFALIGLIGDHPTWRTFLPELPKTRHQIVRCKTGSEVGTLINMNPALTSSDSNDAPPTPTLPQYTLWILPQSDLQHRLEMLAQYSAALSPTVWDWLQIQAGEPHITAATQGLLVPQRANFDLLDGIHFKKGCYPGQEVVARLQYRGVTRHRTVLMHTQEAQVGQEVFHRDETAVSTEIEAPTPLNESNEAAPCGVVLNVAAHPTLKGRVDCLVMLALTTLEGGTLHVGSLNGPILERLPLPYTLPEEPQRAAQ